MTRFICKLFVERNSYTSISFFSGIFFLFILPSYTYTQNVIPRHSFPFSFHDTIPCAVKWDETKRVTNPAIRSLDPHLAIVNNTVHILFQSGDINCCNTTDGGNTFQNNTLIVPHDSIEPQVYKRPFVASGSSVYFVWGNRNVSGTITSIKLRRSTDNGNTWLEPQIVVQRGTGSSFYRVPMIAAESSNVYRAVLKIG
jgi:hypothetical protein